MVFFYILESIPDGKEKYLLKKAKKESVSFNDNNNKVYLIDGRLTTVRNNIQRERLRDDMNNLEDEIEELTRQLRNNRRNRK